MASIMGKQAWWYICVGPRGRGALNWFVQYPAIRARLLMGVAARQGVTIVPMSIYFNDRGIAKVLLGLARGKRKVDKRQTTKDRDWQRQKARVMRERG